MAPAPLALRGQVEKLNYKGLALLTLSASIALWALIISAGAAILKLGLR